MSRRELSQLKRLYTLHNKDNVVQKIVIDEVECQEIFEVFMCSIDFDGPDGYCVKGNTLYILEHFQVDSSKCSSTGSYLKHQEHKRDKELKLRVSKKRNMNFTYIDLESSVENYLKNIDIVTENHYKKLEEYKKRLKDNNVFSDEITEVKTIFVIENPQELGPIYVSEGSSEQGIFYPVCYKEYLESLRKYKDLDYIIFFNHDGFSETGFWIVKLDTIEEILQYGDIDSIKGKRLMEGYLEITSNNIE